MDTTPETVDAPVEEQIFGRRHYLGEEEDPGERGVILRSLDSDDISSQDAAERLAAETLKGEPLKEEDLYSSLRDTWRPILAEAYRDPFHWTLVELLATIAQLPPARDEQGVQREVYGLRVWNDLPAFGWELYDDWQYNAHPTKGRTDQQTIATFVNINRFAAHLTRNERLVRENYDIWALWCMREALETPEVHREFKWYISGAIAWLSVLGPEIYSWDKEFPSGKKEGDPGVGGPLWSGKHGFCKERWKLWKQRLVELAAPWSELSYELRELATEGARKMSEAESADWLV